MPPLHQACLKNIETARQTRPEGPPIEALCMDARDFRFPLQPLVVYLFNPFPEPVFAAVLSHLGQSILENPRPVYVAYRYIEHEQLLADSGWLTKVAGTEQWVIYQNL
jgi:hypothetical protein